MSRPLSIRVGLVAALTSLAAGCGIPRDPGGTSERIRVTHGLRVGFSENAPWIQAGVGEPRGIEPELVRRLARSLGARVLWVKGSETRLVQALEEGKLDLVIGGFDKTSPWIAKAGVTQPFVRDNQGKQHVFLAQPGENGFILTVDRMLTEHKRLLERPS